MGRRPKSVYLDTSGGTVIADGEGNGAGDDAASGAPNSGDSSIIDPGKLAGSGDGSQSGGEPGDNGGTRKRRARSDRGRPRGSRAPKEGQISLGGLKAVLFDTHLMLAGLCQAPGIAIAEDEAERLAAAIGRVSRWYDIPEIGEKAMDHYTLVVAAAMIYGTRFFAWLNTSKEAAQNAKGAPGPGRPAPPRPAPQPPTGPRGDGSLSLVDVNLGHIEVPPLPGAQPHRDRPH